MSRANLAAVGLGPSGKRADGVQRTSEFNTRRSRQPEPGGSGSVEVGMLG
jgi:hypothetical protein